MTTREPHTDFNFLQKNLKHSHYFISEQMRQKHLSSETMTEHLAI